MPEIYRYLALTFSDGYVGVAALTLLFKKKLFSQIGNFNEFSLSQGTLNWGDKDIAVEYLRQITQGEFGDITANPDDIKTILQDALWQAVEENRPDIFQGAIAMLVEHYGHARVIRQAGIKSRTSAYRSLNGESSPKSETLVRLGHAALDISQSAQPDVLTK
jgi:DNA-binding phage protein